MTLETLVQQLNTMPPYLTVQLWDSKAERFTEDIELIQSALDDELLIVPRSASRAGLPEKSWKPLFEVPPA